MSLGLGGVFISALLGHFSIILKDVFFVPIFLYVGQFWNPLVMGLVGGIGGGIGEMGVYLMGRGVGKLSNEVEPSKIPNWLRRLGLFSILLCSLTPIPDAPILMLLGTTRFPIAIVLVLEILGKVILYTLVAIAGELVFSSLHGIIPQPWDAILIISASISLSVLISWKKTRTPLLKLALRVFERLGISNDAN